METTRAKTNQPLNLELKKLIFEDKQAEIRISIQKSKRLVDKIRAEGHLKERNVEREKVIQLLSTIN